MGRGSVGDVTFTRIDGEQVARARNRSPKNPQTVLQLLQRVVMKTAAQAYSLMQEITDHSFQGFAQGTPNQSQFVKRNVGLLREQLADEINSGDATVILSSEKANFASKLSSLAVINPYLVSEGSIPTLLIEWPNFVPILKFNREFDHEPSYQEVVDALGLNQGDQLTFMCLSTDDDPYHEEMRGQFNGFSFARVILEPASGDMSVPFIVGEPGSYAVNDPNPRNEGSLSCGFTQATPTQPTDINGIGFSTSGMSANPRMSSAIAAATVIASRLVGKMWTRSSQRLTLRGTDSQGLIDYEVFWLGDSVASFLTEANSSLYLNQADSFK